MPESANTNIVLIETIENLAEQIQGNIGELKSKGAAQQVAKVLASKNLAKWQLSGLAELRRVFE